AYSPEISGTEKPMEFAFLNGILASAQFPPHDPWLSGYSISYYYLGYVIAALLTRLSALPSEVTFNLMGISLVALTVSGALALVYDLLAKPQRNIAADGDRATGYGLLGALLVAFMGNLEGVLELIRARGWGSDGFWGWFDVRNLTASVPSHTWYPEDMWWWWRASRVIHDRSVSGATQEVISEFPFFSFLLGDNHPHVLAMPFVLLALACALNVLKSSASTDSTGSSEDAPTEGPQAWHLRRSDLALWGVLVGSLIFLNTWDYPIYLGLMAACIAIGHYRHRTRNARWLLESLDGILGLAFVSVLIYLPFLLSLRSQAGGIGIVPEHIKTQWQQFLLMFGVQLWLVMGYLVALGWRWIRETSTRPPISALIWVIAVTVAGVYATTFGWWTAVLCLVPLGMAGAMLLWQIASASKAPADEQAPASILPLLMVTAGLLLVLAVEFVYLRDVFDSRMNTVFKFYYQAWLLLSLAGAAGLAQVIALIKGAKRALRRVGQAWLVISALLIASGMSYTLAAAVSRAGAFRGSATLNGTAYVSAQRPDQAAVISWLRTEAKPDAIIVEAVGGSYTAQSWVSAHTGLQSLLGWAGHERQWRGSGELPAEREAIVEAIYAGGDPAATRRLLVEHGVDYVLVGPEERDRYHIGEQTLALLDGLMVRALQNEEYIVYARTW
ncbi:MAG: hypothetical protein GXY79_12315, partial [Chloroflexi bacterium]|nr:hypothetical protein [Chloroflexota bacterium]